MGDALNIDRYEQPRGRVPIGEVKEEEEDEVITDTVGIHDSIPNLIEMTWEGTEEYWPTIRSAIDTGVGVVSAWSASSTLSFWAGH